MAMPPKPAAAPEVVPAVPTPPVVPTPITASTPAPAMPWWVPQWPQVLGTGIFGFSWWIMWMLAPEKGQPPSILFNLLAQAIVISAFVGGVVAAVYTASRDSAKKNDVIAAQAQTIASQVATPPQA